MKRSELQRKAPLRRKPLRRVVVVRGGRPRGRRVVDERRGRWNRAIRGTVCVVCRGRPATEAHHIVREQVLRREAPGRGFDFDEVRFDPRNRLGVCKDCHAAHHARVRPISRETLWRYAPWVFEFATDLDLAWWLDREYGQPVKDAA